MTRDTNAIALGRITVRTVVRFASNWIGVIGSAITLFGNLDAILSLAVWARWIIENWLELVRYCWRVVFNQFGIADNASLRFDLTFWLFLILTAVGSRLRSKDKSKLPRIRESFASAWLAVMFFWLIVTIGPYILTFQARFPDLCTIIFGSLTWMMMFLAVHHWPIWAAYSTATALTAFFFIMIAAAHTQIAAESLPLSAAIPLHFVGALTALMIASPSNFPKKLWSILALVGVLFAFSEISKLGIDFKPPI